MQFFFNQHIFRIEQNEYSKENIDWHHIEFQDNQPVIDLLASKPAGILSILDDECSFPQASDTSFLEKCHFHHADNPLYEKPRMSDPEFFVRHYAGKIKYNVSFFSHSHILLLRYSGTCAIRHPSFPTSCVIHQKFMVSKYFC